MKNIIPLLISFIMLSTSCKTTTPVQTFNIGKGGGFTGKYDEYTLKSTGEVYNISNKQAPVLMEKLNKDVTKAIFDKFNKLNVASVNFLHPANMTSYISCEINGKNYQIKWGDSRNLPPHEIQDFFDFVWSTVRPK
jgi:hypothetical protein